MRQCFALLAPVKLALAEIFFAPEGHGSDFVARCRQRNDGIVVSELPINPFKWVLAFWSDDLQARSNVRPAVLLDRGEHFFVALTNGEANFLATVMSGSKSNKDRNTRIVHSGLTKKVRHSAPKTLDMEQERPRAVACTDFVSCFFSHFRMSVWSPSAILWKSAELRQNLRTTVPSLNN